MHESRTKNCIKNISTGMIAQLINKVLSFIVRMVFIKVLNTQYLGVNGLFANILTMLSFAELGIGTAIVFNMYKPIAYNDNEKLRSLIKLYKTCYSIIGSVIFVLGIIIIPFIKYFIKGINIEENIIFIYLLFLIDTTISYLFSYKKSVISSHQKQCIINNVNSIFCFLKSIFQIIFLLITKNYIFYLIVQILSTLLNNIVLSYKAKKMYPHLFEKTNEEISKEEKKNIFKNVKYLIIYKFGSVIMNGSDNILISLLTNVNMVGLCSNYLLVITSINSVIKTAMNGTIASIGNVNAEKDVVKKEKLFCQLTFINHIIYSTCAILFVVFIDSFIKLWLGENYLLNIGISISLSFNFYLEGIRNTGYMYRTTLGLFQKGKSAPYIAAFSNILFSLLLGKLYGVMGIFIATSIAQLISYCIIDPYLIYKYEFKSSPTNYFKTFILYILIFIFELILLYAVANFISINGVFGLILKFISVILIILIYIYIIFRNKKEYTETKKIILELFKRGKNVFNKK